MDNKKILAIYSGFFLALIFNFIPLMIIQQIGGFLLLATIIGAYVLKWRSEDGSFTQSHMRYLIKTFWISSLFLLIGIIGCLILGNHERIHQMAEMIQRGMILSEQEIMAILMSYGVQNALIFSICLAPAILYLFYRLVKGGLKAFKTEAILNQKSWF